MNTPANKSASQPTLTSGLTNVIDPQSPIPLYHQIYQYYRQQILTGQMKQGEQLPGEQHQVELFGVSRITTKRAMDELAEAGLVVRKRGQGTFVSYVGDPQSVSADMSGWIQNLVTIGEMTSVKVISFEYVASNEKIANRLGIKPNSAVQMVKRVRFKNDKPFSFSVTYVPEEIGKTYNREDLKNQPLLSLVEKAGYLIFEANQIVRAEAASQEVASMLDLKIHAPVLNLSREVKDPDGKVIQSMDLFYRADTFQLNMQLNRPTGDSAAHFWTSNASSVIDS